MRHQNVFGKTSVLVAGAALLALGTGCGNPSDGPIEPTSYNLDPGRYSFSLQAAISNSCWPNSPNWPPLITTSVEVIESSGGPALASGSTPVTILPPHPIQWLAPPLSGQKDGDQVSIEGRRIVPYSFLCSLDTQDSLSATLSADDIFDGELDVSFSAAVVSSSGSMSNCTGMAGKIVNMVVPFPTLSSPATGSCSVSVAVHAEPET